MGPLRCHPWLRPQVWGGRRLVEQFGKPVATTDPVGESWELSDHPLHRSVIVNGPCAGRTLRQLLEERPEALLGRGAALGAPFPWLIKLLDVQDRLSVQVHPDDEIARRLRPGESGKTECWLVLDAAPGSYVWAGLRPGVDESALRAALGAGRLLECLAGFSPQPGDCLLLPAGTVHAVGGGVLLAEVQQTSDVTFRLYDWDRRDAPGKARPLHLSEALASIAWRQGPVQPISIPGFRNNPGQRQRLPLVRCPYFHLDYLADTQSFPCGGQGRLEALLVVGGRGRLVHAEGEETLLPGQVWLLPAAMSAAQCLPEEGLGMVLCSLPGTSPEISRLAQR